MKIIDEFKKQHILVQILDILFIIAFIYEMITMQNLTVTWILLFLTLLIPFCQWFFKKED